MGLLVKPGVSATIVTGCGQGIGLACLQSIAQQEWNQFTFGVTRSRTSALDECLALIDAPVDIRYLDVSDGDLSDNFFSEIDDSMRIERVILNAGIRSRAALEAAEMSLFSDILRVNFLSQVKWAKACISRAVRLDHHLTILAVSSIVGGRGFSGLTTYAASKSALEGFVRSAAVEFATKNIQINAIAPGFVESSYASDFRLNRPDLYRWTLDQTPMGRWGRCSEVAELASFLVSPANSYMTGSVIPCDGGWTSK